MNLLEASVEKFSVNRIRSFFYCIVLINRTFCIRTFQIRTRLAHIEHEQQFCRFEK